MAEVVIDIVGRDNFSSTLGNFGNIITGIRSAVDLVSGAFNAVSGAISPFITAATESEDAVANLDATLRSMGDVTGLSSQQLQDMAGALQQVTRFSDESIINAEAMLLTFGNIGGETFPRATEAMLDLAAKFGSLDQASVMLGKALNDPIAGVTALRRVGVQLSEEQENSIKLFMEQGDIAGAQAVILGELERQVGGLAEAYGETFAGKLEIFKNRLGEIQEVIGKALIPILTSMMDKFIEWLPVLEDFGGRVAGVFEAIADAGIGSVEFQDAIANLFGVDTPDEILPKIDQFVANIFNSIADAINAWASGPGPDQLSDRIISFIDNLGSGGSIDSKALQAMQRVLVALVNAIGRIDWGTIGGLIDQKLNAAMDVLFDNIDASFANWSVDVGNSIKQGFINALNNIDIQAQRWVDDHIINPIKRALGISSPSAVFADIGRNIVLGLISGLGSMAGTLLTIVNSIVDLILAPLQPVLDLLGVDSNTGVGGATGVFTGTLGGGGSTGSGQGGGTAPTSGQVVNNFYGTVNFNGLQQVGYDCPSPNPLVAASGNTMLTPITVG